jgi:hypothetical protein
MQLKGSSLGFEHDGDKLRIREVKEEGDFKDILQHIRFLVHLIFIAIEFVSVSTSKSARYESMGEW